MASRQGFSNVNEDEPELPPSVLSLKSKFESLSTGDLTNLDEKTAKRRTVKGCKNGTSEPNVFKARPIPPPRQVSSTIGSSTGRKVSGSIQRLASNFKNPSNPHADVSKIDRLPSDSSESHVATPSSPTISNSFVSVSPLLKRPQQKGPEISFQSSVQSTKGNDLMKHDDTNNHQIPPPKPNFSSKAGSSSPISVSPLKNVKAYISQSPTHSEASSVLSSEEEEENVINSSKSVPSFDLHDPFSQTFGKECPISTAPPVLNIGDRSLETPPPIPSPRPPQPVAVEAIQQSRAVISQQLPLHVSPRKPPKPPLRKVSTQRSSSPIENLATKSDASLVTGLQSSPYTHIAPASEMSLIPEKPRLPPRPSHTLSELSSPALTSENLSSKPSPLFPPPPPRVKSLATNKPVSMPVSTEQSDPSVAASSSSSSQLDVVLKGSIPDTSSVRRNPPCFVNGVESINVDFEARIFDVSGDRLVLAGNGGLRVYDTVTGLCHWHMPLGDTKVTSLSFKSSPENYSDDGRFVWFGTRDGMLWEVDVQNHHIVTKKSVSNCPITYVMVYKNEMWTLDDMGKLYVWQEDEIMGLSIQSTPHSIRTIPHATHAMVLDNRLLWVVVGKSIYVYDPSTSENESASVLAKPMTPPGLIGDISCGTTISNFTDLVFYGHVDGKISIFSKTQYRFLELITSSSFYRICSLVGVGNTLWAAYTTGMIYVFDVSESPWRLLKSWHGHKASHNGATTILGIDVNSVWKAKRLQVVSMASSVVKFWDGLMMGDWLATEMRSRFPEYSNFTDVSILICSWNAGASKPSDLDSDTIGASMIPMMIRDNGYPDIVVFGFQELVDLENKRLTARSILSKSSSKGGSSNSANISSQYRLWREKLESEMMRVSSNDDYQVLVCENLVGLFSCVFVKNKLQSKIRMLQSTTVKTGLGGLHGNKGAIVVRFLVDDTSYCIVNCHLAAGQSNKAARNNDLATILDNASLFPENDETDQLNTFVGGGDGSLIMDHEVCVLHGDLNYRINTLRPKALDLIKKNDIKTLLQSDQLLVERKRNAGFRLRTFTEPEITFAPTYKYDVHSEQYDSSEKKRVPAWCDRICYRGSPDYISAENYTRYELKASDHRPVSALIHSKAKMVNAQSQGSTWDVVKRKWIEYADEFKRKAKYVFFWRILLTNQNNLCHELYFCVLSNG